MESNGLPLIILMFLYLASISQADFLEDNYPATIIEDAKLDTVQLLKKYKYPAETHFVTTRDKYILGMYRIPNPKGKPILLIHGLMDSSIIWILMGPWSGFGYYLYDQGYDVWMGNVRGNLYSRNHSTYNPSTDKLFWKFSWHEIGIYDLPAMIDYVLEKTNHKKLTYIGHSQGTTVFFVMGSMLPAYNSKINSMHAFAPVAFFKHFNSPLLPIKNNLYTITNILEELPARPPILTKSCLVSKTTLDACIEFFMLLMGKDSKEMNATMWPVILSQLPGGASSRQLKHFLQLMNTDHFRQLDHGAIENMKLYHSVQPPDYPVQNIKVPIALYHAKNDYLSSIPDVEHLAQLLPNVIERKLFPYKKWNHMSMVWGISSRKAVQKHVLEVIKKFE